MANKTMGTTLTKKKSGSESEDTQIASLTSIGEIGIESAEIDVTSLDSESGYNEFIAGNKDSGEVSLSGIIKQESQMELMLALAEIQSLEDWVVTYPSGATWEFKGFLKTFTDGEKNTEGAGTFNGSIRISGKVEFSSGQASA